MEEKVIRVRGLPKVPLETLAELDISFDCSRRKGYTVELDPPYLCNRIDGRVLIEPTQYFYTLDVHIVDTNGNSERIVHRLKSDEVDGHEDMSKAFSLREIAKVKFWCGNMWPIDRGLLLGFDGKLKRTVVPPINFIINTERTYIPRVMMPCEPEEAFVTVENLGSMAGIPYIDVYSEGELVASQEFPSTSPSESREMRFDLHYDKPYSTPVGIKVNTGYILDGIKHSTDDMYEEIVVRKEEIDYLPIAAALVAAVGVGLLGYVAWGK